VRPDRLVQPRRIELQTPGLGGASKREDQADARSAARTRPRLLWSGPMFPCRLAATSSKSPRSRLERARLLRWPRPPPSRPLSFGAI
jgi:hypothetical protein